MRIHFLASTALVLLASTAALAGENDAYVLQVGNHDKVNQTQEGFDDTAVAIQAGNRNRATQHQLAGSAGNVALSLQTGRLNTVKQTQGAEGVAVDTFRPADRSGPVKTRSTFDIASVSSAAVAVQDGARNMATQTQIGAYNLAASVQVGKDNYVLQTQGTIGETTTPYTNADGRGTVRSDAPEYSVGSFAGVLQVGDWHGATQEQSGIGHTATVLQVGSDDGSYQTQTGFGQEALSIQIGAANRSTQTQSGLVNTGAVVQAGVGNYAYQTQK
ncbi:hypothetical protein GGE65_003299 [Skermanella aerolata]|uniref:hypothetical protein n=1 Tax=Skermanella aerolata TaxID=393310 RepID=UPI003D1E40EB